MASHSRIPGLVAQDRPRAVKEPHRGHRRPVYPHVHGADAGASGTGPEKACAVITLPPSLPTQAFALPGHTAAGRVSLAGQRTDRPGNDVPGSEPSPAQARTGYGCPIPVMSLPSQAASRAPRSQTRPAVSMARFLMATDRLPSLYIYALQPSAEMRAHGMSSAFDHLEQRDDPG